MFTGIVEEVGSVEELAALGGGRRIRIRAAGVLDGLAEGDSVSVDGVCLTAAALPGDGTFVVEATATTLGRTTLGRWEQGRRVNLERAMAADGRFGGHLVQGHVDGVGTVRAIRGMSEQHLVEIELPEDVAKATIERGSIAVDGVSMTVAGMPGPAVALLAVIPYTWSHTNFARLQPGSAVNLEADLIGRYVAKHLESIGVTRPGNP